MPACALQLHRGVAGEIVAGAVRVIERYWVWTITWQAARPARPDAELLEGGAPGLEIRREEGRIGVEHADEGELGEVVALAIIWSADRDVGLAVLPIWASRTHWSAGASGVAIDPQHAR